MIPLVLAYAAGFVSGAVALLFVAVCFAAKLYDGALGE